MGNANTPHSRRLRAESAKRWTAERISEGWRRVTVMLPPDALARLDRLASRHGTLSKAVAAALVALEESELD